MSQLRNGLMLPTGAATAAASTVDGAISAHRRDRHLETFVCAVAVGVGIAGFWHVSLVDGFGRDLATRTMGGFEGRAAEFSTLGPAFGFFFAVIAGLAATFTACNCVAFAMIPSLACTADARTRRRSALRVLSIMAFWVVVVCGAYGAFVGRLGPAGAEHFNAREVRFALSFAVFGILGGAMLFWGAIETGLLQGLVARCSTVTRAFFAQPATKAAFMGAMVGAFAIGRPFGVFREFLLYAAQTSQPAYGAAVMAVQGLAQILVMAVLFVLMVTAGRSVLDRWARENPEQPARVSAFALSAGGAFFVYYWMIARLWPGLGRWGYSLGIY